jgi:PAS domain S-box-containing protein
MSEQNKELENSLAFALESVKLGTWDIDLENDTVRCSQEMLSLWEIDPKTFNGNRNLLQEKVHREDREVMVYAINDAIEKRAIYEIEYRIFPRPGMEKWILSRGRCTYRPGSDVPVRFAGIVYDITERKNREKALAEAIRARDSFFMIAGHELRTPLACLHLQIEVLNWELKNNFPEVFQKENIEMGLKKQQEHLFRVSQIIDNILSEARSSQKGELSLQSHSMDLQELTLDVIGRISVAAEVSQTVLEFTKGEPVVGCWDSSRIEQIIINLLTNALKYGNKNLVQVEIRKKERHAYLVVKDFGIGIAAEDHERIFEQFERVISNQRITGMGLGLYISRKIARAHGGDILVRSEVGQGSEFTLKLPII